MEKSNRQNRLKLLLLIVVLAIAAICVAFYISDKTKSGEPPAAEETATDYHTGDYSLYYMNIRDNAAKRVEAYMTSK